MFDTILWASDGSARAGRALGRVRELCEQDGSSLWIVHVAVGLGGGRFPAPDMGSREDRLIAKLKAETRSLRRHGVDAHLHVVRGAAGEPAGHILEVARAIDADLIITTTRGHAPLRAAIGGSVTQRLMAAAPCPVLVLPASSGGDGECPVAGRRSSVSA